jgi:hypothetical protein
MASYLDNLYALRDKLLQAAIDGPTGEGLSSYSLDGESWSAADVAGQLDKLRELIRIEENRVSGRRQLLLPRGRWPYAYGASGWYGWGWR